MTERIIKFRPAWNKTSDDPSKDYGIGAMSIWFYLKGPLAVVQFHLNTRWYLPGDRSPMIGQPYEMEEIDPKRLARMRQYAGLLGSKTTRKVVLADYYDVMDCGQPDGWDVGYHSPVALYEKQTSTGQCEFFESPKQCFYDGSSIRAREWAEKFLAEGEDFLWPAMEEELASVEARVKEQMELLRNCS